MQQFIAKFKDHIQGVMSGLDRVLFRGTLRRLTHSKGMKWYLAENNILCKQYQDHVKDISQKLKEAALRPFRFISTASIRNSAGCMRGFRRGSPSRFTFVLTAGNG